LIEFHRAKGRKAGLQVKVAHAVATRLSAICDSICYGRSMNLPQRTRLVRALGAAGVIVLIMVVAFLGGRRDESDPPPQGAEGQGEQLTPPEGSAALLQPPALRRSDLVAAAAQAAAAYAAGLPYSDDNRNLVGRRFEVVIAFGCSGPRDVDIGGPARWTFDARQQSMTLTAQPQIWTETEWVNEIVGPGPFEAIEGFWIPRPWLLTESCPPLRLAPASETEADDEDEQAVEGDVAEAVEAPEPAASDPSVGLVRTYDAQASRAGQRRARPYQVVRRVSAQESTDAPREFQLVLSGRITGLPGGEAVRCHSDSIDRRPICLIGVEVARVAFIEPGAARPLAEWGG